MAAVALEIVETALLLQQELQTLAAAAEAVETRDALVVQVLSLFAMLILLRRQYPLQVLQQ